MKEKISLMPYNNHNGIVILCKYCGSEFEETCEGNYEHIEYEEDKYDRYCKSCLVSLGKLS